MVWEVRAWSENERPFAIVMVESQYISTCMSLWEALFHCRCCSGQRTAEVLRDVIRRNITWLWSSPITLQWTGPGNISAFSHSSNIIYLIDHRPHSLPHPSGSGRRPSSASAWRPPGEVRGYFSPAESWDSKNNISTQWCSLTGRLLKSQNYW